ncbi:elongation factor G-binding protein [Streptococcus parauberis]|uniref:elongation factor G-binding protein n=1 Tax=Streptococcus parauberis TaxID=1348 RepID=UPI0037B90581
MERKLSHLKVYEFNQIKGLIKELINYYKTNDYLNYALLIKETLLEIGAILIEHEIDSQMFMTNLADKRISRRQVDNLLEDLKVRVEPFTIPSNKEITKLLRKVKKLKVPDFETYDKKEIIYLAWNEQSSNRKYVLYEDNNKSAAFYGDLSTDKVKDFCKICKEETETSLFLLKSKTSGDGTYTKKGDYICRDSAICNQNLKNIDDFYDFVNHMKA